MGRRVGHEGASVPFRGVVSRVGLHVVNIEKERRVVRRRETIENRRVDLSGRRRPQPRALTLAQEERVGLALVQLVRERLPCVEAPGESQLSRDVHEVSGDPEGAIAGFVETFDERQVLGLEVTSPGRSSVDGR